MRRCSLAIVGAGPAGLSAALAAAGEGVKPIVIDENPRIGGQIYRQPPEEIADQLPPGRGVVSRFHDVRDRVELLSSTTVWGLFPPNRLGLDCQGRCEILQADHVILAPGAHEYLPPFPGWTLPGVMTPEAAQGLVKAMHVRPGKRTLIAGTGPFLLVVAEALHRAGTHVVGIVEMARRREAIRALPGLLSCPGLFCEGLGFLTRLRMKGIPIHRGHVLIEARGEDQVRQAVFAPCDMDGNPDRARTRTVDVDTICAGYGFVPRIQLAQLAGCQLRFDDALGGWLPAVDENLETSVPGVWVAGDGGGIAGALVAELEGSLAGFAAARRLGAISDSAFKDRKKPLVRQLVRRARFRAALNRLYRLRPGLNSLATADTIVCRCEEVTRAEVQTAIAAGGTEFRTLKVMTRVGMGPCQGLMCGPALCRYLAHRSGKPIEEVGPPSVRPPITPVSLAGLAGAAL